MQREGKTEKTVDHEMMNLTWKPVTFDQLTLDGEMKATEGVFSSKAVSRMKASWASTRIAINNAKSC